jgi:hypothetical protein
VTEGELLTAPPDEEDREGDLEGVRDLEGDLEEVPLGVRERLGLWLGEEPGLRVAVGVESPDFEGETEGVGLAAPPELGERDGDTVGVGVEAPPLEEPVGLGERVLVGVMLGVGDGEASTTPCTKMGELYTVPALVAEFHTRVRLPMAPVHTLLNCSTP